jgi:single-strand DNA-binding protein
MSYGVQAMGVTASTLSASYFLPHFSMKSVNTVTLLGRVANPPEEKSLPSGQIVCKFGLATNRVWKDAKGEKQEQVEFHNLVVWGKLGEFCSKYVKKGKPVYVEGHLKTGTWESPQGMKLHRTEIVVDNIVLLGSKDKSPEVEKPAMAEDVAVAA